MLKKPVVTMVSRRAFSVQLLALSCLFWEIRGVHQSTLEDSDGPVVTTSKGKVRGLRYDLPHLGAAGEAYLGIPFAAPPVGSRRFRYPEPVEPWANRNVILNATTLPNSCYQAPDQFFGDQFWGSNMWNPNTPVSEDCLYLNVWVPTAAPPRDGVDASSARRRPLAVMVWIFGGGFYSGTTTLTLYDGQILASLNDVIVVSIGYRVGAVGFLCLDDPSAPCNMGLFDQLMGLDWVQKNINRFGGDPSNVTLFGESAGAASVSLHLLSPLSRDKFHRAILQSGSANMPWATTTLAEGIQRSRELATGYVGCDESDDVRDLARCLREQDIDFLLEQQWVSRGILQFPFLPVVDRLFLAESPETLLRLGRFKRCPILIGSNLNEGSWFLIYELPELLALDKAHMPRDIYKTSLRQLFFHYPQYPQRLNSSQVLDAIAFFYSDWLSPNDTLANLAGLDQAIGDSYFVCPLNRFAMRYAEAGLDVYMYHLTQRYSNHPWPQWMGVMHGDDILFVFGHVLREVLNFTKDDQQLSRRVMTYWTNFAKSGTPNEMADGRQRAEQMASSSSSSTFSASAAATVEWPKYSASKQEYLELNEQRLAASSVDPDSSSSSPSSCSACSSGSAIGQGPRATQCAFWTEYVPKLLTTTANADEKKKEWKKRFAEWSTVHVPRWKKEYDLYNSQKQCNAR